MVQFNIVRVAIDRHQAMYDEATGAMAAALGDLGHGCTISANRIAGDAVNILMGSTIFAAGLLRLESKLRGVPHIVYQLEQLDAAHGLLPGHPGYAAVLANASRIWDYGPSSAAFLRDRGLPAVELLPPAYHPSLERFRPSAEPDIDVIFAGSGQPRRTRVLEALAAAGARVVNLSGCYGRQRDELLSRARIVLNIHAWDDLKTLETVRLSYLLANRCFVISETGDHDPYDAGIVYADHAALAATCLEWLRRPAAERRAVAEHGYRALRAQPLAGLLEPLLAGMRPPLRADRSMSLVFPAPADHPDEAAALRYWSREGAGRGAVFVTGALPAPLRSSLPADAAEGEADIIRLLILGMHASYRQYREAMDRWLGRVEDCGALALLGVGRDPGATRLHQEILRDNHAVQEVCRSGSLSIFGKR